MTIHEKKCMTPRTLLETLRMKVRRPGCSKGRSRMFLGWSWDNYVSTCKVITSCTKWQKCRVYDSVFTIKYHVHNSTPLIYYFPNTLPPKLFSRSPITWSPTPFSPIVCSATLTPRSIFPSNHSLPDHLLAPTYSVPSLLMEIFLPDCLIALPLIFEK